MTATQRRHAADDAAREAAFWGGDDELPTCANPACRHHTHMAATDPCDTPGCKCAALVIVPVTPVAGPKLEDLRSALLCLLIEAQDEANVALGALTGLDLRVGTNDAVNGLARILVKLGAAVHVAGKIKVAP
jgi:hypothetical protein